MRLDYATIEQIRALRVAELRAISDLFPPRSRLLEVGAGTGQQAALLAEDGHDVEAVDLANSTYSDNLVYPVRTYDGRRLPFDDGTFDVVYTAMLVEHLTDPPSMHREIARVLARDGIAVHVVPTPIWRAWTTATAVPSAMLQLLTVAERGWYATARGAAGTLLPRRHGESGNILSETWLYHPRVWRRILRQSGFSIVAERPVGLFYTGNSLLGPRLSMALRQRLARALGSVTHAIVARPH